MSTTNAASCPTAKDTLDTYLNTAEHLPPMPTLLIKLIELFRQPDHDLDEIVGVMKKDVSITAELLRRCNGAFFGGNEEPVSDVYEAVFRLGFYEVYRITVALFGAQAIQTAKTQGFAVEALWRHSAVTAVAAGIIARELDESEGIAFTSGLLHDVGKIVLASTDGSRYVQLLTANATSGALLSTEEQKIYGFNHCDIGARLLERWGIPDQVVVPVQSHHLTFWNGTFARLSAVICLANLMAHCLDNTAPEKPCELPEAINAMSLLGVKQEDIAALQPDLRRDLKRLVPLLAGN